ETRMTRGHDAAERRLVAVRRVSARIGRPRCPGFAGNAVADERGAITGAALLRDDALHHSQQLACDALVDDALARYGCIDAAQRHGATDAACAENCVRTRELQRRHGETVAVRNGRLFDLAPMRCVVEQSGRFAWEAAAGHLAETERTQRVVHRFR